MKNQIRIAKVVSDGEFGVNCDALFAAFICQVERAGWCRELIKSSRKNLSVENLKILQGKEREAIIEANIADSDAVLNITFGHCTEADIHIAALADKHNRPCLSVDFTKVRGSLEDGPVNDWFEGKLDITAPPDNCALNIVGKYDHCYYPGIELSVCGALVGMLSNLNNIEKASKAEIDRKLDRMMSH